MLTVRHHFVEKLIEKKRNLFSEVHVALLFIE